MAGHRPSALMANGIKAALETGVPISSRSTYHSRDLSMADITRMFPGLVQDLSDLSCLPQA